MNIIRFSIQRPIATLMMLLTLVVFGIYTYRMIAVDMMPDVELPIAAVIIIYPGAGPEDIENGVVRQVEDQFATLQGLKRQTVTSREGVAVWILEYEMDQSIDFAALDIRDKLDGIREDLPEEIKEPIIFKMDFNAFPFMRIAVQVPENENLATVRRTVEDEIAPRFARLSGVASAEVSGGLIREIHVDTDPTELEARGLSLMTIFQLIGASNLNYPLGTIKENSHETIVRIDGEYKTVEELAEMEIPTPAGVLRLKDIAHVDDSFEDPTQRTWYNSKQTVSISISKRSEANLVKTAQRAAQEVKAINEELPEGWNLIVVRNDATYIENSVNGVYSDIMLGIGLTALLLILFLRNPATTLIAAVSMPVSIISTFTLIFAAGFTLNMMSLMALGLAVGLLVTNAIVVLENIIYHLDSKGDNPARAAEKGTSRVAVAVSASMLTNVAVFVPLAFMQSIMGKMFREFGLTMVFATAMSLFITFTLTPLMASKILKKRKEGELIDDETSNRWMPRLVRAYGRLLDRVLTPLGLVSITAIALVMLLSAVIIFSKKGFDFIPKSDEGVIRVAIEMPLGSNLEATDRAAYLLGDKIQTLPDVFKSYVISGGSAMRGGTNQATIIVEIPPKDKRTMSLAAHMQAIRQMAAEIPDAKVNVVPGSSVMGGEGGAGDLQIQLVGTHLDDLLQYSDDVIQLLEAYPGVSSVESSWKLGAPEFVLTPDYPALADYGMTVGQIAQLLNLYMTGTEASVLRQREEEVSIVVRFAEEFRKSPEEVLALPVPTPRGQVPLSALVHSQESKGPNSLMRLDKQRLINLDVTLFSGVAMGDVQSYFNSKAKELPRRGDATYKYGGNAEAMMEGMTDMAMAMVIAIILTYMLLAAMLESFWQPLVIMLTIPLGIIGVMWALQIADLTISIMALMAMVMLIGVVVNNAILILEYSNWLRINRSLGWKEAVHQGARSKFRAVMMTNIASITAMIPLALGFSEGAELRQPMAVASVGGLLISALMTLFLIPAYYWALPSIASKLRNRLSRKRAKA